MPNPSLLTDEQWLEAEKMAVAGVSLADISRRYEIDVNVVKQRAWAYEWATPARVAKAKAELTASKAQANVNGSNLTVPNHGVKTIEVVAETLAQYGEETALIVARGASKLLKQTFNAENPLLSAPDNWKTASIAFGMVSKATGRDRPQLQMAVAFSPGWGATVQAESHAGDWAEDADPQP